MARYFLINLCIYVSWKRGPSWWLKIGPTVMYLLCLINYIILPVISIVWFFINWQLVSESVYGVYM